MSGNGNNLVVRRLGRKPYREVWEAMKEFTDSRTETAPDECWLVEHDPVFTQGQAGKPEHILFPSSIPVVRTDRGGQVTYHGPGQLVAYCLVDLRRAGLGVREFVSRLEESVIRMLAGYGIAAERQPGAPGVYVEGAKIASLGLRVRKGCTYHGVSINVDMDLSPFRQINPCGYAGLKVTQLSCLLPVPPSLDEAGQGLLRELVGILGYLEAVPLEEGDG